MDQNMINTLITLAAGVFGWLMKTLWDSVRKLEKEIGGLRGRLNNPKFVESAPEDVVAEARENLALREEEAAKLQAALDRLSELG